MDRDRLKVTVVCFADENAIKHGYFMAESMMKLATNAERIKFIAVYPGEPFEIKAPFNDTVFFPGPAPWYTAPALNLGMKYAYDQNPDILIVADADTAVTMRDWDTKVIECLSDDTVGIVGVGNPGGYLGKRHLNFPVTQFLAMRSKVYDRVQPDLRQQRQVDYPAKEEFWKILSKKEAAILDMPVGMNMHRDIGWHLPFMFKEHGYTGRVFDYVKTHDSAAKLGLVAVLKRKKSGSRPIRDKCLSEYQLDGDPIVTHLRQTRKREYKNGLAVAWRAAIIDYVSRTYGVTLVD